MEDVSKNLKDLRQVQKQYSDRTSRQYIPPGTPVRMQVNHRNWIPATVMNTGPQPRSYDVVTPDGRKYRRNQHHIRPTQAEIPPPPVITADGSSEIKPEDPAPQPVEPDNTVTTRSGRVIKKTVRLDL